MLAARDSLKPRRRKKKPIFRVGMNVGQLTIPNFITIPLSSTVKDAIHSVRASAKHGIFYLYTVNDKNQLAGVVSVRSLLVAKDEDKISSIHAEGVVSLDESMAVEKAYQIFSDSKFLSLPVVNSKGELVGVLHAHELLEEYEKDLDDLLEERTRGELFELLGIQGLDPVKSPVSVALNRLPWLLINLLGGAISAFFIHDLADGLAEAVLYLAFVPILLIITESMGMQVMSIVIGHLNRLSTGISFRELFAREMTIAFLLALSCGLCIGLPAYLWKGSPALGITIALTILIGFLSACTLGHVFPALFHRMKVDPQIAAGPVVLAIADASTLVLYLLLALWISGLFA